MAESYTKLGRGGAGNFYSKKDIASVFSLLHLHPSKTPNNHQPDLEAQIQDLTRTPTTSNPPEYQHTGRGGAGNFVAPGELLSQGLTQTQSTATPADEEDLTPIGGVDEDEGISLEEETTILTEAKRQDLTTRFKKAADGVYVEAKRSAIGGMTQVPLYFYGLLLALGWNEIWAGKWIVRSGLVRVDANNLQFYAIPCTLFS